MPLFLSLENNFQQDLNSYRIESQRFEKMAKAKGDSFWAKRFRIRQANAYMLQSQFDLTAQLLAISHYPNQASLSDSLEAEILLEEGQIKEYEGSVVEASKKFYQALALQEKLGHLVGQGKSLNRLVKIFSMQNNLDEAEKTAQQALQVFQKIDDKSGIARSLTNLGIVFSKKGNFLGAKRYHEKALEVGRKAGDIRSIVVALDNIGNTFLHIFDGKSALPYFLESLSLQEKLEDIPGLIVVTYNIGKSYEHLNKFDQAVSYYQRSLELAQRDKFPEDMYYATLSMAEIYQKMGRFKESNVYFQQHLAWKDSLFNAQQNRTLNELGAKYETAKKEQALALQKAELQVKDQRIEKERLFRIGLMIGLSLLGILLIGLIRAIRAKNKSARLLEVQKAELEKLNSVKDRLFSILGHDLRQPVASISMSLDLISAQNSPRQDLIQKARIAVESTLDLIHNLLYWSQLQLRISQTPVLKKVNPAELIEETLEPLQMAAELKGIRIQVDCPSDLIIETDLSRLAIVVRNLVSNAIKFSPENGLITLMAGLQSGIFFLEIADQGPGIQESILPKVFGGLSTQGSKGEKGTGIGLGLCKDLCQLLGGKIEARNQEHGGAVFRVEIPAG